MHSLHRLLIRLCSHMLNSPHILMRLRGQMRDPRHSLWKVRGTLLNQHDGGQVCSLTPVAAAKQAEGQVAGEGLPRSRYQIFSRLRGLVVLLQ